MEIRVAPGETIESALRRFKKATQKAGVLAEARKHEHYEKPSVRRKKKSAAARKRRSYRVTGPAGRRLQIMSIKDDDHRRHEGRDACA